MTAENSGVSMATVGLLSDSTVLQQAVLLSIARPREKEDTCALVYTRIVISQTYFPGLIYFQ